MNTSMAQSLDRTQYERSRVEFYNTSEGDLTEYDCPKCRNRGLFAHLREDNTMAFSECSCMKIRNALQRLERSGLFQPVKQLTFDKYLADKVWQQKLKDGVMEYAAGDDGWLLISGQTGIGKTHLCTAVCRERILRQQDVRYMSWRDEVSRLKAINGDVKEREELLHQLKTAQVLYIDDLFKNGAGPDGKAWPTSADVSLAFEILNYRYNSHLCTLLSTEKSIPELLKIDEATASRILERCGKHAYGIKPGEGMNYRLREQ